MFGIAGSSSTDEGRNLLGFDSGVDLNRALFDVHELHEVSTFAAWWRDVLELAKERYYIENRLRPTIEYWFYFLSRFSPGDALEIIESLDLEKY